MNITKETAKQIINVFGPCSHVYECYSPEDIINDAEEYDNLRELFDLYIDVAEIRADRSNGAASYRGDEYHKKVIQENKEMISGIEDRANAFLKGEI